MTLRPPAACRRRFRGAAVICAVLASVILAGPAEAHDGPHGDDFVNGAEVAPPAGVAAAPAVTGRALAPGPRTVAVVLLNFAAAPTEPWTADQARSAIFTGAGSVSAFEGEQSFGTLSLTGRLRSDGDVFGWYTIAAGSSTCDPDAWMSAANAAAAAAGVDLSGYQHHVYMFPRVAACGWAGAADMPGMDSFINGTLSVRVIAHELGHNLGAHHASTISCVDAAGARVPFSASCTMSEYGDPFDVMGSSDRQSVAFRKVGYGFLGAGATQTVTQSGTYELSSSSVSGSGVRSLRVPRGGGDWWYLELRSPVGQFDDFGSTDPAVTGVGVREAGDYGTGVRTRLIDMTPATATYADAPLQPGQSFTDPFTGIGIAVQSVALGVASVAVTLPGGGVPPAPAPAPAPVVNPPSTQGPTATIVVRRLSRTRMLVRLASAATGTRCAVRPGVPRWSACRVVAGRVALTRIVPVPGRRALVALRIDGVLTLAKRLPVPPPGGVTRLTTALRGR